jgi:hypothetical protein
VLHVQKVAKLNLRLQEYYQAIILEEPDPNVHPEDAFAGVVQRLLLLLGFYPGQQQQQQ